MLSQKKQLLAKVTELLARQTGRQPDEIDASLPFSAFGIDSVTAVGLSGELEAAVGFRLSPTLLYENANIGALVDSLCAQAAELAAVPEGHVVAERLRLALDRSRKKSKVTKKRRRLKRKER